MARSADFLRTSALEDRPRASRATVAENDLDDTLPDEPVGRSYENEREWNRAGAFGLGVLAGALVGAGVALLFAPESGEETRERIATRARDFGVRADEGWNDLRDELRRLRRRSRRAATRGRWKVEDLLE